MTLTLSYNGAEIINYHPTAEQWWITGFNSNYMRVKACDLTATFSVRFTDQEMYDAFYGTWNNREQTAVDGFLMGQRAQLHCVFETNRREKMMKKLIAMFMTLCCSLVLSSCNIPSARRRFFTYPMKKY